MQRERPDGRVVVPAISARSVERLVSYHGVKVARVSKASKKSNGRVRAAALSSRKGAAADGGILAARCDAYECEVAEGCVVSTREGLMRQATSYGPDGGGILGERAKAAGCILVYVTGGRVPGLLAPTRCGGQQQNASNHRDKTNDWVHRTLQAERSGEEWGR